MADPDKILKVEGFVEESLPGLLFSITIDTSDGEKKTVLEHLAGKMKLYRIKVVPGDNVLIEMSSATDERGRIIRRL